MLRSAGTGSDSEGFVILCFCTDKGGKCITTLLMLVLGQKKSIETLETNVPVLKLHFNLVVFLLWFLILQVYHIIENKAILYLRASLILTQGKLKFTEAEEPWNLRLWNLNLKQINGLWLSISQLITHYGLQNKNILVWECSIWGQGNGNVKSGLHYYILLK